LLRLTPDEVIGVTAAHSVSIGNPDRPLEQIALVMAGSSDVVVEFRKLRGQPGRSRTGEDMTVDYLLLVSEQTVDPDLVLLPDPRGGPQAGERVSLYSGLLDNQSQRAMEGTVQSTGATAIWVLLDERFEPYGMSGSALLSQHTGKAVGMAVAISPRRNRLLLGAHPIGSIVRIAESATESIALSEWRESQRRSSD
jgi:hypothetical protein